MYVATIGIAPKIAHFHTNLIFSQAICANEFNIKEALVVSTRYWKVAGPLGSEDNQLFRLTYTKKKLLKMRPGMQKNMRGVDEIVIDSNEVLQWSLEMVLNPYE